MSERLYKQQDELAILIERYTGQDGTHATAIPSLFVNRQSKVARPTYGVFKPPLCIIVQMYGWQRSALGIVLPINTHPLQVATRNCCKKLNTKACCIIKTLYRRLFFFSMCSCFDAYE